uniref:AlNc14C88G5600 protein n=1 Tax=Albugo laibachii Nc14 TaxID=890382 RepID=F0WG70_9STRA|nr:AlNc14C88G5600 [Albugo laibachii Nc14]|eukprot:CCA20205.1 AlNc14C88G5600 [Albugo laibachii Nc14]
MIVTLAAVETNATLIRRSFNQAQIETKTRIYGINTSTLASLESSRKPIITPKVLELLKFLIDAHGSDQLSAFLEALMRHMVSSYHFYSMN